MSFAPESKPLQQIPAPAAINRHWIKPEQAETVRGLGWASEFFKQASSAWDNVNKLRAQARPDMTKAAHQMQINRAFEQTSKRVSSSYDTARERLAESRKAYQAEIEEAAGLNKISPHDSEIRQVVRNMSARQRHQAAITAIEQGDADTMRAILTAPAITTGIEADKLANLRAAWTRKTAPELVAKLEQVDKAEQRVIEGFDSWLTEGERLSYRREVEAAQQAQAEAERISQGFAHEPVGS